MSHQPAPWSVDSAGPSVPPDARCQLDPLGVHVPEVHGRRTRQRARPQAAQTRRTGRRPGPMIAAESGGTSSSATSAAPKGRRSERSWPPAVPPAWSTLRSASWRYPSSACTDDQHTCRCLTGEASQFPLDRLFSRSAARAGRSLRSQLARRSCTGSLHAKVLQNDLTLARHRPIAGHSPSGPAGSKLWPGENVERATSSPAFTDRPMQQGNFGFSQHADRSCSGVLALDGFD